jgi:hypothetical protein
VAPGGGITKAGNNQAHRALIEGPGPIGCTSTEPKPAKSRAGEAEHQWREGMRAEAEPPLVLYEDRNPAGAAALRDTLARCGVDRPYEADGPVRDDTPAAAVERPFTHGQGNNAGYSSYAPSWPICLADYQAGSPSEPRQQGGVWSPASGPDLRRGVAGLVFWCHSLEAASPLVSPW